MVGKSQSPREASSSTSSPSKTLIAHGGLYAMARFAERGLGILLVPLYARQLRGEGYGVIALLGAVMPFLGLLFEQGMLAAWFRLRHNYEEAQQRRVFETTVIWYLLASGTLLLALTTALGPLWSQWLGVDAPFFPLVFMTLLTAALQVYPNLYIRRENSEQRPLRAISFSLPKTLLTRWESGGGSDSHGAFWSGGSAADSTRATATRVHPYAAHLSPLWPAFGATPTRRSTQRDGKSGLDNSFS